MANTYFEALKGAIPPQYRPQLDTLPSGIHPVLDIILGFSAGGQCPKDASSETRKQWSTSQATFRSSLSGLKTPPGTKRAREDDDSPDDHPDTKKPRPEGDEEDTPLFTLHSISVTSPVRKKVNIAIHKHSLRLTNPTSGAVESNIPIGYLKRAFLLPTRGKNKPHWTVIISSSDTPPSTGKASAGNSKEDQPQVVFGIDASPPPFAITDFVSGSPNPVTHPKGTPILQYLHTFLSHLPFSTLEPSAAVFRSAVSSSNAQGGGVAGVDGFRGAKPGTLWFFEQGLLWDGKPSEFWHLGDLVGGSRKGKERAVDVDLGGAGGVRTISATGRSCSVILRRKIPPREPVEGESEGEEEEEHGEDGVDTDIGMVDGKEQEAISRWVKKYRSLFGLPPVLENGARQQLHQNEEDDSDEDDSDFTADGESDGGSATSESGEDEGGGDGDGDGEGNENTSGEEDGGSSPLSEDEMDVEDLDPKRHPLLRPGAMPRMSKAAMKAAIGIVEDAFIGPSGGDGEDNDIEEDEEEDELED